MNTFPSHLFPYSTQYHRLDDGHRLAYIDEGPKDTKPLVLVHGNPTWSFYWRAIIASESKRRRVIAIDHIGCGRSDKPSDARYPYRLDRRIADLDSLLSHLSVETLDLGVHDWGGMIGMGWAHAHPTRIDKIVLLNTAAFRLPKTKKLPATLRLARDYGLGALMVRGLNAFSVGATRMAVTRKPLDKEVRNGLTAPYNSWDNRRAVLRFVQDIPLSPKDPSYATVVAVEEGLAQWDEHPVLICWGEKDFVFDKHFLKVWEDKLPQAVVHRFPECGHYILEDAQTEVVSLVAEFLATP